MNQVIYKNRNKVLVVSIFLILIGILLGYVKYGVEPWETIGGFFFGIGISLAIISLSLKKPKQNIS